MGPGLGNLHPEIIIFPLRRNYRKGLGLKIISAWKRMRFPVWVTCAFLMTGCLYSTHHFNSGRLLDPGMSDVTVGGGYSQAPGFGCSSNPNVIEFQDSTGARHCEDDSREASDGNGSSNPHFLVTDPKKFALPFYSGSLGYRLGIHGKLGPFSGLEMGLHLESPTNPVSGEFDLKLGLPVPKGLAFHHSLSAGWSIGMWADNSSFLEYAASRPFGLSDLFVNYRATYLASQSADLLGSEDARRFLSKRRLIHQSSLGFKWALPEILIVPDYIIPEVGLTYPLGPTGSDAIPAYVLDDRAWNFTLGMGWNFK